MSQPHHFPQSLTRRQFVAGAGPALLLAAAPGASAEPGQVTVLTAGRFRAAPDGREREVWGYNRRFPGPEIRAKEGETVRVKLVNELAVPTSIHWHGMHQPGTWRMDGVEGVSAPPVAPGKEFTYEFKATPAG
ncbi:MAG: multicopper oxidase domain-containing protein, partial [Gemmataceae bacterium]